MPQVIDLLDAIIRHDGHASYEQIAQAIWGAPSRWPSWWLKKVNDRAYMARNVIEPWGFRLNAIAKVGYRLDVGEPRIERTIRPRRSDEWSPIEAAALRRAIKAQKSWTDVRRMLPGRSREAIRQQARRMCSATLPKEGPVGRRPFWTPKRLAILRALADEGMPCELIGERFGKTAKAVDCAIRYHIDRTKRHEVASRKAA